LRDISLALCGFAAVGFGFASGFSGAAGAAGFAGSGAAGAAGSASIASAEVANMQAANIRAEYFIVIPFGFGDPILPFFDDGSGSFREEFANLQISRRARRSGGRAGRAWPYLPTVLEFGALTPTMVASPPSRAAEIIFHAEVYVRSG